MDEPKVKLRFKPNGPGGMVTYNDFYNAKNPDPVREEARSYAEGLVKAFPGNFEIDVDPPKPERKVAVPEAEEKAEVGPAENKAALPPAKNKGR